MKKYRVDDGGNDEWAETDTDGPRRAARKTVEMWNQSCCFKFPIFMKSF